jgi:hypothetical protein
MRSFLHLVRCFLGVDSPFSQVTGRELDLLIHYSRGAKVICEIGCYEGRTSVALAQNATGVVYSIDPFFKGRLGLCYGKWIAQLHRRRNEARNLFFVSGFSRDVAPTLQLPIDFLFIDADHSYDAIKQDWDLWYPKVVNHGIIAVHDCKPAINSPNLLGTMKFYSGDVPTFPDVTEIDAVDSLVILQVEREQQSVDDKQGRPGRIHIPLAQREVHHEA